MANSLVVHIILKEGSEVSPKTSVQLEFVGAGSNTEHLGLFWSYLPHLNSELRIIFLLDSLFFKEYCIKIWEFFSTGQLISWPDGRSIGSIVQPVRQNFFKAVYRFVEAAGKRHYF